MPTLLPSPFGSQACCHRLRTPFIINEMVTEKTEEMLCITGNEMSGSMLTTKFPEETAMLNPNYIIGTIDIYLPRLSVPLQLY